MRSTSEVARSAGQVDEDYGIIEDISMSATSVNVLRGIRKSACFSILGHSAYGKSHSRQIRVCRYTYIAILVWGIWKSEQFLNTGNPPQIPRGRRSIFAGWFFVSINPFSHDARPMN